MNSGAADVLNSYISDIKAVNADSQAIAGWNGAGPYHIVNNYLEASGENLMFGGGVPSTTGLISSDIEISGNDISKPTAWRNPILAPPGSAHASASSTSGSLAAGTHISRWWRCCCHQARQGVAAVGGSLGTSPRETE